MSNNKSAWTEVLKQWEPSAGSEAVTSAASTALFPVTNNVTRQTFECVKKHPGITALQVVAMLPQQKANSVKSLLTQMVKNGLCRKQDDGFYTLAPEYRSLKRTYAKYAAVKKVKAKPRLGPRPHNGATTCPSKGATTCYGKQPTDVPQRG